MRPLVRARNPRTVFDRFHRERTLHIRAVQPGASRRPFGNGPRPDAVPVQHQLKLSLIAEVRVQQTRIVGQIQCPRQPVGRRFFEPSLTE